MDEGNRPSPYSWADRMDSEKPLEYESEVTSTSTPVTNIKQKSYGRESRETPSSHLGKECNSSSFLWSNQDALNGESNPTNYSIATDNLGQNSYDAGASADGCPCLDEKCNSTPCVWAECDNSRDTFQNEYDLTASSMEIIDPSEKPRNNDAYNENTPCLENKDNFSTRVSAASEDKELCESDAITSSVAGINSRENSEDGYAYGGVSPNMEKECCPSPGASESRKDCDIKYKKESDALRSLIASMSRKQKYRGNVAHGKTNPYRGEKGSPTAWAGHKDSKYDYPHEYDVTASSTATMNNWQMSYGRNVYSDTNLYMEREGYFSPCTWADASTGAKWKYAPDASTSTTAIINDRNAYDDTNLYNYNEYYSFPYTWVGSTNYGNSCLYKYEAIEPLNTSSDHRHSSYGNLETRKNAFGDLSFYMGGYLCYSPFVSENSMDSRNAWEYEPIASTSSISTINDRQNSYERNAYGDINVSMEREFNFSPGACASRKDSDQANQNQSDMSTSSTATINRKQNSNDRDAYGNAGLHMGGEYYSAPNSLERTDVSGDKLQCKTDSRQKNSASNNMTVSMDAIKSKQNRYEKDASEDSCSHKNLKFITSEDPSLEPEKENSLKEHLNIVQSSSAVEPPEVNLLIEKIQNAKLRFEELIDEDESLSSFQNQKINYKKSEKILSDASTQTANDPESLRGTPLTYISEKVPVLHDSNTAAASTDLPVLSNTAAASTPPYALLDKTIASSLSPAHFDTAAVSGTAAASTPLSERSSTTLSSIPQPALSNTATISNFSRTFSNTKAAISSLPARSSVRCKSAGRAIAHKPLSGRRSSTTARTPLPIGNATTEIENPHANVQNTVPNLFLNVNKNYCLTLQKIIRRFPATRNFLYKGYITIQPVSSDERNEIIKFLDEQKEGYFLTEPPNELPIFRAVIKGIAPHTPTEVVKQDLTEKSFKILRVWQMTHRWTKEPFPLYVIDVRKTANASEIFNLKECLHYKIRVEPYKSKLNSLQCFLCCGYGHSPQDCDEI
ncbi:hypothetical protein AVEN_147838-1 [Araneus ventricosus]|uniref:Pre-C2HC domain-containing protein n=1 Tax=Araneus ventricosus TaxID=182803 RepID=A0A4Y2CT84_ARAVE|nr:hypothetical protein AVEN_147838-1 [Araneus ventricosus]